jgi:hypothetical protein
MSLFRPTALRYIRNLGCATALVLGLLSLWSASAPASSGKSDEEPAACPGQTFSQPFEAFGDSNFYTLVEGSEFNGGAEGWDLRNGAQVVEGTRPDGSSGGVLDLPSGAIAISPVVCVTLQYPTARTWVEAVDGNGGVTMGVYYAGAKPTGHAVGRLNAKEGNGWELSRPFNIKPQLTGSEEGVREVRFIYVNTTRAGDLHVWGLYVDPRMR